MKPDDATANFAPQILVMRRVAPVALTIMLWGMLIEGARLLVQAL